LFTCKYRFRFWCSSGIIVFPLPVRAHLAAAERIVTSVVVVETREDDGFGRAKSEGPWQIAT
jgi:hypothetical protein